MAATPDMLARPQAIFTDHYAPLLCLQHSDRRQTTNFSLTHYSPVVTICTTSLTFTTSTFCPHSCIYVFCVDLRTNSDYFPVQH